MNATKKMNATILEIEQYSTKVKYDDTFKD
jgi:hypothetical protein